MLLAVILLIVLAFGAAVWRGAPYLPTRQRDLNAALDLAQLTPGQRLVDLGSGDGAVLLAAARRGLKVTGVEINPLLLAVAYLRTWRYQAQVKLVWGDMWSYDLSRADVVFVFLLPRFMSKLDRHLANQRRPMKLISYCFAVPERRPTRQNANTYFYEYPVD